MCVSLVAGGSSFRQRPLSVSKACNIQYARHQVTGDWIASNDRELRGGSFFFFLPFLWLPRRRRRRVIPQFSVFPKSKYEAKAETTSQREIDVTQRAV